MTIPTGWQSAGLDWVAIWRDMYDRVAFLILIQNFILCFQLHTMFYILVTKQLSFQINGLIV